jgi:tetratricopeptide (TPR) repeat protein
MARTAEASDRYEDMCKFMKYLVTEIGIKKNHHLSVEERNLLSVAYKNVIGARRSSWRTLPMIVEEEETQALKEDIAKYPKLVETELTQTCEEVLELLEKLVGQTGDDVEAKVFYLKMAGDYYRYLAESVEDGGYGESARKYYQQAYDVAATTEDGLLPTHPIRLGLALNFSVCYYEILKDKKAACDLAKEAFDNAISKLDKLEESDYKDSTLIMQLLRDNLTLWTSNEDDSNVQVEDISGDDEVN